MGLRDEFRVSTPKPLACGHPAEAAVCSCGVAYGHGGIAIGDDSHRRRCSLCTPPKED